MGLKQRRLIYLGFFLVFLIVGGWLIFYLQGFRYNPSKGHVEQIGAIAVETNPTGATAFLNGEKQSRLSPLTINSLTPGEYELLLHLGGWQAWQKKITVNPMQVANLGTIQFWLPPQTKNSATVSHLINTKLSPNNETVLYQTNQPINNLYLLNLKSGQDTLISPPVPLPLSQISFSPSGRALLAINSLNHKNRAFIYDIGLQKWSSALTNQTEDFDTLTWGENDDYLIKNKTNSLFLIDRHTDKSTLISQNEISDFKMLNGLLYLMVPEDKKLNLKIINTKNLETVTWPTPTAFSLHSTLLNPQGNWLPILDTENHSLYLVRSPLKYQVYLRKLTDVDTIEWLDNNQKLLATNVYEIWDYAPNEDNLNLIWRVSTPLTRVRQYLDTPYLILATGNELWALEYYHRGEQQRWLLAQYQNPITDFFIDTAGDSATVISGDELFRLAFKQPVLLDGPSKD